MNLSDPDTSSQDEAARAGWLAHVGGLTQDQIAVELGVSRQRAQRLVARAMAEGMIHVRLEHRLASCFELEAQLKERFGLARCRVAPGLGPDADPAQATAGVAAGLLESVLSNPQPQVIAFGTGRALSAMSLELSRMACERHRIVSLIGNIAPDGSASFFDVLLRIADRIRATHFPMPVPVISETPEERALFLELRPVRAVVDLAQAADVSFVGIGQMGEDAPIHVDGFVSAGDLAAIQVQGAVGEITGTVYDIDGRCLETPLSGRMGGVRVEPGRSAPVIGVAAGLSKVAAIRGAITGRLINGLVTDEPTARALLA